MKTILAAALLLGLAGPDYEKMLAEAKFPLAEAIDRGLKEAKEGTVIKVQIEVEKGKTIYTMDIAQGEKILEINLDVKDGAVAERKVEEENMSKVVKAAKITLKQAIEASLKKSEGKAVSAGISLKDDKPLIEVRVFRSGKVTTVRITPPNAPLNVNARPWGDVFLDGAALGQTPLANMPVPIGTHEVVLRHPQFGESRQTIVVTARGPNRITHDFTK